MELQNHQCDHVTMEDHFTVFVYPFEHGKLSDDHFLNSAWEAGWRPWICRATDFKEIEKLPENLRKFFNPPAMETLYPEIHKLSQCKDYYCHICEPCNACETPDKIRQKNLFEKLTNQAKQSESIKEILKNIWSGLTPDDTLRMSFDFEKDKKRHWKFCFIREEKTEEINFKIDWIDAYMFRFGVGFLCIKVSIEKIGFDPKESKKDEDLERLMLFHQYFRDIDDYGKVVCENQSLWLTKSEFLDQWLLALKERSFSKDKVLSIERHTFRLKLFSFISLNGENWFDKISETDKYYQEIDRFDSILYEVATTAGMRSLSSSKKWQPSQEYLKDEMIKNNKISIWRYWRGMALRDTAVFISLSKKGQPVADQYELLYFPLYVYVLNLKMQLFQFSTRLNLRRLKKKDKLINEALEDFLIFRNDYWFCEVSPNFQMSALYKKLKYGLELDTDYSGVSEEINNIFQYQESQYGKRLNKLVLILTAGSILVGLLGINTSRLIFLLILSIAMLLIFIFYSKNSRNDNEPNETKISR